jgi:Flp pilus assembly protein CpaB
MNRRRVIGVSAAVVLAGLGAAGVLSWASSTKSNAADQQTQTAVVIVDKHVPKGADAATILAGTHEGSVQRKALAEGALTSESQVGTQVTSADLYPGEQLVEARLTVRADNGLPAGTVEYGVKLEAEAAVGGLVKAHDKVDVFLTFKAADPAPSTYATLASVPVTNVLTAATTTDDNGAVKSPQYVVTLALTPDQSAQVLKASTVWLARPVVK